MLLLYTLYAGLSVVVSNPKLFGVFELSKMLGGLVVFLAAAAYLRTIREWTVLVVALARPQSSRLTDREREVASMVGDGLSNKEIAGMLRISPATVKNHVHNILDKLDLPSRSAIGGRLEVTARAA